METVCIVSSVYGGYDSPVEIVEQDHPHDAVLVSDLEYVVDGWRTVVEPREHMHPRMAAKIAKCRPDLYTDAKVTIWIDASIRILRPDFVSWCVAQIGVNPIAQIKHPERDRITDEADVSAHMAKYQGQNVREQAAYYVKHGFPEGWGMWATGLIVRRTSRLTVAFGADWLFEQTRWTYQDQVSEAPLLEGRNMRPVDLDTELWSSPYFTVRPHGSDY